MQLILYQSGGRLRCANKIDFDADKPMQYEELQMKMASIYENQDPSLFGKVKASSCQSRSSEQSKPSRHLPVES